MATVSNGVFTLRVTNTETETKADNTDAESDGNSCLCLSLCRVNIPHNFICNGLGVGQCKHTISGDKTCFSLVHCLGHTRLDVHAYTPNV